MISNPPGQEWKKAAPNFSCCRYLTINPAMGTIFQKFDPASFGRGFEFSMSPRFYPLLHRFRETGMDRGVMGGEGRAAQAAVLQTGPREV